MHIIAGLYRHQRLAAPKGQATKPTASRLRESLFNICQPIVEGAHFLDLFAGSGAMGFEALSRGAASATFIENHREALRCIQQNIQTLDLQKQTQVLAGDVFQFLKKLAKQNRLFDIIFMDPPYGISLYPEGPIYSEAILQFIDENQLLAPNGWLFIEEDIRSQPHVNLKTLELKSSRRMGNTILQQYHHSS